MDYYQRAKFFRTKKRLGQNFLTDGSVIERIIAEANISKNDTILEIGAGVGFVTEQLVKFAKKVYAVELDEEAIIELQKIDADNLEIIHNDILKTDISCFGDGKIKIIANIPYYITTPILAHLLGEIDDLNNKNRKHISEIILMVQYEVALRILANENSPSKQYGHLSILSQFFTEIELIQKVSKRAFFPSPKVDSALLKFKINDAPKVIVDDYTFLKKVTKACFLTRRKNIKNSLANAGFSKTAVIETLEKLCISENTRGETLSIHKLAELALELKKHL